MFDWLKEIKIEDLDETYKQIAEIIGAENFFKLAKEFGGTTWYIPQTKRITMDAIKKRVFKEYNGYNVKELAIKYEISERSVRNFIEDPLITDTQTSLFN